MSGVLVADLLGLGYFALGLWLVTAVASGVIRLLEDQTRRRGR